jgi:hypothetical protein
MNNDYKEFKILLSKIDDVNKQNYFTEEWKESCKNNNIVRHIKRMKKYIKQQKEENLRIEMDFDTAILKFIEDNSPGFSNLPEHEEFSSFITSKIPFPDATNWNKKSNMKKNNNVNIFIKFQFFN